MWISGFSAAFEVSNYTAECNPETVIGILEFYDIIL